MLPDFLTILIVICVGLAMNLLPLLLPKKISTAAEIIVAVVVLIYLFMNYSFGHASILIAFGASSYGSFAQLADPHKSKKRKQLIQLVEQKNNQELIQKKQTKRIAVDIGLTLLVSLGAMLFIWFAPMQYSILKMFIGLMFLTVLAQTIERMGTFYSTKAYWLPDEERLVVISLFQSRDFPLQDLQRVQTESSPDLLRLHPLFTFLTTNQDYTSSFSRVLKLSFPGEQIYISPLEIDHWSDCFTEFIALEKHASEREAPKKVLPIWHKTVLKRLFWKGYFAIAVKGISAYTGLLFLLIWLDVPAWMIVLFVLLWWGLNVAVSDRVLTAATDAEPMEEGVALHTAKQILKRAGIPNTRLLVIDSPIYNGLATGMNIGRGAIILTSATLKLPLEAIEAIVAHEAIHIKKRDVLFIQIMRMLAIGLLIGSVYLFFESIQMFAESSPVLLFISVYVLTMLFPAYLSAVGQWAEVRADHLGATLLRDGNAQMADGLEALALAQHADIKKSVQYSSTIEQTDLRGPDTERGAWIWRIIEFQILPHPPMYWRLQSLRQHTSLGQARLRWMSGRFLESLPDFLRRKVH